MEDKHILLKWNNHHATFNHVISQIKYKRSYTDVTLACSGKFYSLHKLVLATCSEYFNEIFEISECKYSMIILTGIQCSDLEILLDYMYTGEVNIQKNKLTPLMKAAEFLRIKGLVIHDEEPKSLSCSIVSRQPNLPLHGKTVEDSSMDLNPIQNLKNSEKESEIYSVQSISFENGTEAKDISTTDEREDASDIEIISMADFSNNIQTTMGKDGPITVSDFNISDCGGPSGINNINTASGTRDESGFTENFSDDETEKLCSPMKRRRTDTGRSPDFSSSRPCKLMQDPESSTYYLATETLALNNSWNNKNLIPFHQDDSIVKDKGSILCEQENCNEDFKTIDNLRNHLSNKHGEDHPKIVLLFKTWEDLEKWKKEFEEENVVNFRLRKNEYRKKGKVSYYVCNRSNCFLKKSKSTGKRKTKKVLEDGPLQISSACTAGLIISESDGFFHVTAYPTHANHPLDDEHIKCLKLPETRKDEYIKQIGMIDDSIVKDKGSILCEQENCNDTGRSLDFSSSTPCKLIRDPQSSMYYLATEMLALNNSCNNKNQIPVHQDDSIEKDKGSIMCEHENCNEGFKTIDLLRNHLSNKHGEDHPKIALSFKTWEDLEKWKKEFEDENVVYLRHLTCITRKKGSKVSYYRCNRSSCFLQKKSKSTGKRKTKKGLVDGPSQIASVCTAGMRISESDGSFHVTAYPTHANHHLDDGHIKCLRLPETLKNEYIKQIGMGVPLHVIRHGIDEEVKKQYRISYSMLFQLKKKYIARTGIPTEKSLLSIPE